jgi:RepB DNA-primase from phage plasmid
VLPDRGERTPELPAYRSYGLLEAEVGDVIITLWRHIYGEQAGAVGLFSGTRREPGLTRLESPRQAYFAWPAEEERAQTWIEREAAAHRETYHCGHLLTDRRRIKENAAPLSALYVDGDGAKVRPGMPSPTAVVESSPGREQFYWGLSRPVAPEVGERLNRRLAFAMGADRSGWDLSQLLRPPGTHNHKYTDAPLVRVLELKDERHGPDDLDRLLPPLPQEEPKGAGSYRPEKVGGRPDLCRLPRRMQDLIHGGNRGAYPCRSRADMAACVAMFVAGYSEAEVWAAMTDPTNGISGKFLEKGRHGERYLTLTIGKARTRAQASPHAGRGKVYARREGVIRRG